jgi:predicted RNA-binding protein
VTVVPGNSERPVWLLVTRQGLWDEFKSRSSWSFHRQSLRQAQRIRAGDLGIVYLTKQGSRTGGQDFSRISAVVELEEEVRAPTEAGSPATFYPYVLRFHVVHEPRAPVPFLRLVPLLAFIKRKDRYGVFLQGKSAILLSSEDAETMLRSLVAPPAKRQEAPDRR